VETAPDGTESAITRYKQDGRIKRQATRFRVFQYQSDNAGSLQLVGEVTPKQAKIEWTVDLVNRKAALDHQPAPGHPSGPRNTDVTNRNSLIIRNPKPVVISGQNQLGNPFTGSFLGQNVYLGELRTDGLGRLLVLGGRGISASVPAGQDLPEFANNDKWHDDVSDGPVSATVTLPGQPPTFVHQPAWVVVAPPDFAPGIDAIVTLYDVAFQAAIDKGVLKSDATPSFRQNIMPLIQRGTNLRWVNKWNRWNMLLPLDWNALADLARLRPRYAKRLVARLNPQDCVTLSSLRSYHAIWTNGCPVPLSRT